ncbi:heparan sulfate glucosamine 3-O-sulfotransferase 1-like [Glandiceps talaboti]
MVMRKKRVILFGLLVIVILLYIRSHTLSITNWKGNADQALDPKYSQHMTGKENTLMISDVKGDTAHISSAYTTLKGEANTSNNGAVKEIIHQGDARGSKRRKRLPGAIIAGIKKCGTASLGTFLDFHPNIVAAEGEVAFFNSPYLYDKGIDWYIGRMPVATPGQLTIERSPAYFHSSKAIKHIHEDLAIDTKIIFVACDPVQRVISDYCQLLHFKEKHKLFSQKSKPDRFDYKRASQYLKSFLPGGYNFVNTTIESTLMDEEGKLKTKHGLIRRGLYSYFLERWLKYFTPDRILIVDGNTFKVNPLSEIQKVESFLNLQPYFTDDSFYFNKTKGFYCIKVPEFCMGQTKGMDTVGGCDPAVAKT